MKSAPRRDPPLALRLIVVRQCRYIRRFLAICPFAVSTRPPFIPSASGSRSLIYASRVADDISAAARMRIARFAKGWRERRWYLRPPAPRASVLLLLAVFPHSDFRAHTVNSSLCEYEISGIYIHRLPSPFHPHCAYGRRGSSSRTWRETRWGRGGGGWSRPRYKSDKTGGTIFSCRALCQELAARVKISATLVTTL